MMIFKATASCALVGISLVAAGCSSAATGGSAGNEGGASGGDGGSSFSPHVPSNHLTTPITCTSHGDAGAGSVAADQCTQASDCGAGRACMCGEEFPGDVVSRTNVCLPAQCLTDADCGPGNYCSPSIVPLCGAGADGLYCHTAKDTCSDSSDCTDLASSGWGAACTWVGSSWSCVSAQCAG